MIWHLFEVWLILLATFLVGCTVGALAYEIVARTSYATAQGALADSVGDVVDRIKDRFGLGPAWRPQYRRIVETTTPAITAEPPLAKTEPEAAMPEATAESARQDDWADAEAADLAVESASADEAGPIGTVDESPSAGGRRGPSAADAIVPMRPASLAEPRNGVPDNLQRIRGIGERNEMRLNKLGIFHFGQIAAWTPAEMRWVAQQLAFPERIERDDWVGQAIILASGGDTGFTKSAERRRARRKQERNQVGSSEDEPDDRS